MIAIDTNLLVYAHRAALPEHRAARRALEQAWSLHLWGTLGGVAAVVALALPPPAPVPVLAGGR